MNIKTFHIHIGGIVQGVGFRPFVYRLAKEHNLNGWVNNTADGVHIQITSEKIIADNFLKEIERDSPPLAKITSVEIKEVKYEKYTSFEIVHSTEAKNIKLPLTPDVSLCEDCRKELYNINNRRYKYPFITCTNCGPRYSIIKKLPYDRPYTTMSEFKMCEVCFEEYNNPMERRHFSQTNSCSDCKIEMSLFESDKLTKNFSDLQYIADAWNKGKIIAIKGIGGFLLTCDATNVKAINELRKRKKRQTKPFALMYPNIEDIKNDVFLSGPEKKELESIHAPIVLLKLKSEKNKRDKLAIKAINNGLSHVGIMLPYAPVYDLLLNIFKKPIIATSGNISNSVIIFDNEIAIKELTKIVDIILLNNRDITIPQDDGVVRFSEKYQQKITLRRSRGKAPVYLNQNLKLLDKPIFASGSMLKSTFAIINQKNIFVSQYLGNTETYDAQLNYEKTYNHLKEVIKFKPELVISDMHPDYFSSRFANKIGEENNCDVNYLQHHKAHFYAVLGENNLLESEDEIMGVVWDGAGLGEDGNIWGGDFFLYKNKKVKRIFSLNEFDYILGDKMSKEPKISALAIAHNIKIASYLLEKKFSKTELNIYKKILSDNKLKTTSMGRLFDAVSSLLLDADIHGFDAEASLILENEALKYYASNKMTLDETYLYNSEIPEKFTEHIIKEIINDIDNKQDKIYIATKFHLSLVKYIILVAKKFKLNKIAFSGGVFQNSLIVDMIIEFMKEEFDLFFTKEFSPNDEGIPFGQLMYAIK